MSLAAALKGGLEFLKSLPAILAFLMQLKKMWDEYLEVQDRKAKMKELTSAVNKAIETKDTTEVENFFRNLGGKPPG